MTVAESRSKSSPPEHVERAWAKGQRVAKETDVMTFHFKRLSVILMGKSLDLDRALESIDLGKLSLKLVNRLGRKHHAGSSFQYVCHLEVFGGCNRVSASAKKDGKCDASTPASGGPTQCMPGRS
jgi:hypothetical protein